ncbi:MAG TPA: DUF3459 domain-containing protein, partial [Thermoanaerobaculia bacterium]|nr:DUF3459 domain-containing protein [Thermoanaerobaculia bacterium]
RDFYRQLLRLRRETPALRSLDLRAVETRVEGNVVLVRRGDTLVAFNFSDVPADDPPLPAWGFNVWSAAARRRF